MDCNSGKISNHNDIKSQAGIKSQLSTTSADMDMLAASILLNIIFIFSLFFFENT